MVQTNLFSDLYIAKFFLDTSAKPFIPCAVERENCIRMAVECGHKNFWKFLTKLFSDENFWTLFL